MFYTHSIKLESVKQPGMFLHTSNTPYVELPTPSYGLPRVLLTEKTYEVNVSAQFSSYTLSQYARFDSSEKNCLITALHSFRLYHSQSEAFVQASCNLDKDQCPKRVPLSGTQLELPPHLPYLRLLDDTGEEPDPTDPRNHTSKSIWTFEPVSRRRSSTVRWNTPVRIRHVPSGRYLAVDTKRPLKTVSPTETWYMIYLADDSTTGEESDSEDEDEAEADDAASEVRSTGSFRAEHGRSGSFYARRRLARRFAEPEDMVFWVDADGMSGSKMPSGDSTVRIEHWREGRGADGGRLHLFLHNADIPKPPKRNDTDEETEVIESSLLLCFSDQRSAEVRA